MVEYEAEKQAMQGAGRQLKTTHCFARAFAAAGNGRRPNAKGTNKHENREMCASPARVLGEPGSFSRNWLLSAAVLF